MNRHAMAWGRATGCTVLSCHQAEGQGIPLLLLPGKDVPAIDYC